MSDKDDGSITINIKSSG